MIIELFIKKSYVVNKLQCNFNYVVTGVKSIITDFPF